MRGPELTFLERPGGRRGSDRHLSVVIANGRPVLTSDVDLAGALTAAEVEVQRARHSPAAAPAAEAPSCATCSLPLGAGKPARSGGALHHRACLVQAEAGEPVRS